MKVWWKFASLLVFVVVSQGLSAESLWFLIVHAPGPAWDKARDYSEQDGLGAHQDYLSSLADRGILAMAGGFTDQPGGLLLLKQVSVENAREIAYADPMVRSGVLAVELRGWQPELTTMTSVRKRRPAPNIPKGATFKIGSPSQEAPINLEKN